MTALELRRKPQPASVAVRSPRWVLGVDQPAEWARENQWLLEATYAAFAETGEWPLIEDVQASLADQPEHAIATAQLVIDMPSEIGVRYSQNIQLTVRALIHVPAAAGLLDLFVRALRKAVSLYPGDGTERAILRGSELKRTFDLPPLTYRKLVALFSTEGWFFGDGGGDASGDWWRAIRAEILQVRDIKDINGYLEALARYRFGPPQIEVEPGPAPELAPRRNPLRPVSRWLRRSKPTIFDLLVVTVIGGVIVAAVVVYLL